MRRPWQGCRTHSSAFSSNRKSEPLLYHSRWDRPRDLLCYKSLHPAIPGDPVVPAAWPQRSAQDREAPGQELEAARPQRTALEADLGRMMHHRGSGLLSSLLFAASAIQIWTLEQHNSAAFCSPPSASPPAHPFCPTLLPQRNVAMSWAHHPATPCRRKAHRQGVLATTVPGTPCRTQPGLPQQWLAAMALSEAAHGVRGTGGGGQHHHALSRCAASACGGNTC